MPIPITGLFEPSGGAGAFDLYQPEDIQAGNIDVSLTLITSGKILCSGIAGEIKVQTFAGTPVHTANEGTPCWDSTNNKLYVNNDSSTGWTEVGTAGVGTHALLDSTIHTDTTTGTVARGDLITGQTATPEWTRLAIGSSGTFLRSDGTDCAWTAIVDADVPNTITLDNITQITTRSHASLQNLSADDHTQYALLAGRSGGQILIGGTASGNDLELRSTSNATKGTIFLGNSGSPTVAQVDETTAVITAERFVSSIGTGTAPLGVSSTTVVTNLNADLLDGNHSTAFAAASHVHSAADITSGTLAVARGGTNIGSYTGGDIIYATGPTVLALLGIGSSGQVLTVSGGVPAWATLGSTINLNDLADVDTTGVANGDFLQFNGTNWVDFDLLAAGNTWDAQNTFTNGVVLGSTSVVNTTVNLRFGDGDQRILGTTATKTLDVIAGGTSGILNLVANGTSGVINLVPAANVVLGGGVDTVDYSLTFNGHAGDGVLTWMEDEDYFKFSDDVLMDSTERIYFRDTTLLMHSSAAGEITVSSIQTVDDSNAGMNFLAEGGPIGETGATARIYFETSVDHSTAGASEIEFCAINSFANSSLQLVPGQMQFLNSSTVTFQMNLNGSSMTFNPSGLTTTIGFSSSSDMVMNFDNSSTGKITIGLGTGATSTVNIASGSGSLVGVFGVTAVVRQSSTVDIKDALTSYGWLQGTSATPLNLDGGTLTAGDGTFTGNVSVAGILRDGTAQNALELVDTGSANYFRLYNSATGNPIKLWAHGSDTNVGMTLATRGVGGFLFQDGSAVNILTVSPVSSGVTYLTIANATAGNPPTIGAVGEANVGITVQTTGTGVLTLQAAGSTKVLQGTTLGNAVFQLVSTATNDDPTEIVYQNRVATTDATVTTLHTFTVPSTTTYVIESTVVARRTGGVSGSAEDGAGYRIIATYKNVAGTATLIGSVTTLYSAESQAGWDATYSPSGATVLLRVTGAASNNVTWHSTSRVWSVGS